MRFVFFCHSLLSDWNHGNAHFLRGVVTELQRLGHHVGVYEPRDAWSVQNVVAEHGPEALMHFAAAFPHLHSRRYDAGQLDLEAALRDADVVIVHEWNTADLVARVGQHRARGGRYVLLFHDTHHRLVTQPDSLAGYDLRHYDGVLAFGRVLRDLYLQQGLARQAWTWHEAADTTVFYPRPANGCDGDLVWIGNWGDEERTAELREFLIDPVRALGLRARVYGVRYPPEALSALAEAGIEYGGWLPNHLVPEVFARFRVTVHVPRRPYAGALPGIPTIRPFEALACGIPLVSAPWDDAEGLFRPGDFLTVHDGAQMRQALAAVLADDALAHGLAARGRRTVLDRHTCRHRAAQLLSLCRALKAAPVEKEAWVS